MYKGMGVRFADFISFFLNIPFHFHRIFKNGRGGGREGGSSEPPEPPLDPPLTCDFLLINLKDAVQINTINSKNFERILILRIALKYIFAMLKIHN